MFIINRVFCCNWQMIYMNSISKNNMKILELLYKIYYNSQNMEDKWLNKRFKQKN